jgi:hypothetical protein
MYSGGLHIISKTLSKPIRKKGRKKEGRNRTEEMYMFH